MNSLSPICSHSISSSEVAVFMQRLLLVAYRQRWRAVIFHGDSQAVLLLALPVRGRRPRHHLACHTVHTEGQVLVAGSDVVKQHGVGTNVLVGSHHTED